MTGTLALTEWLDSRISSLQGVERRWSRWADRTAFFFGGREVAHFHSDHEIDVRLTRLRQRDLAGRLKGDPRVRFRRHSSEWIAVTFSTRNDAGFILELVEQALRANR